ncbi:MAG: aspartyl protease family protein [Phycisphaerales bacterium]|nr:aspartyl protease family protein [Phycisphaerales bacterium]
MPVIQVLHSQHRPFAAATLEYDNTPLDKVPIKFLIDTGATRSVITPWYERQLRDKYPNINLKFMPDAIKAVQTLNGEVPVRALPRVALRFDTLSGAPLVIPLKWIYFLQPDPPDRKKAKSPPAPLEHSLLGQDVISQHALMTVRVEGGVLTQQSERVSKWTEELCGPAAPAPTTEWVS